jgi:hypothetical protein
MSHDGEQRWRSIAASAVFGAVGMAVILAVLVL